MTPSTRTRLSYSQWCNNKNITKGEFVGNVLSWNHLKMTCPSHDSSPLPPGPESEASPTWTNSAVKHSFRSTPLRQKYENCLPRCPARDHFPHQIDVLKLFVTRGPVSGVYPLYPSNGKRFVYVVAFAPNSIKVAWHHADKYANPHSHRSQCWG